MKRLTFTLLLTFSFVPWRPGSFCLAQNAQIDSLKGLINIQKDDTLKVLNLISLSSAYINSDINEVFRYANEAKIVSEKINFKKGIGLATKSVGLAYSKQGNFSEAILQFQISLEIFKSIQFKTGIANMYSNIGAMYYNMGDDSKAIDFHFKSLRISEEINDQLRIGTSYNNIGSVYTNKEATVDKGLEYFFLALPIFKKIDYLDGVAIVSLNIGEIYQKEKMYDSAIYYFQISIKIYEGTSNAAFPLTHLGQIYAQKGNFEKAYQYHNAAIEIAKRLDTKKELTESILGLAQTQLKQEKIEEAIQNFNKVLRIAEEINSKNDIKTAYEALAKSYAMLGDFKKAYSNSILFIGIKDSLYNNNNDKKIQQLQFNFDIEKKEAAINLLTKDKKLKEATIQRQRVISYSSIAGLFVFLIFAFILYRNNKQKQKANVLLKQQKQKVESTLSELKATQAQLIQSEKMASLGELTAGIAHEIQNPLNFVNNFSEVNTELIDELQNELKAGNTEDAFSILSDIKANEEKINHHGKRADAIVKGMLQHSKTSTGQKEPTNINKLADEYLRISYHGFRGKDKNFNATLKTDFDESIGLINVIPQDIGRVLLNLYNNAFYALHEKSKLNSEEYEPTVSVSTKKINGKFEIRISDNGNGIPQKIVDKIFQPFFTTKPTGQGTGLGLSLSYDIIKAHGGELKVETKEADVSTFMIQLPMT